MNRQNSPEKSDHPIGNLITIVAFIAIGWWAVRRFYRDPPAQPAQSPAVVRVTTTDAGVELAIDPNAIHLGLDDPSLQRLRVAGHRINDLLGQIHRPAGASETVALDPRVRERIEAAQRIVAATPQVSGMWRWEQVRAHVAAFGGTMPIRAASLDHAIAANAIAEFDPVDRALIVSPVFHFYSVEQVATTLVHEATHAEFDLVYQERLRLATDESWIALHDRCRDVRTDAFIANEAVAEHNEGRWIYRNESLDRLIRRPPSLEQAMNDHSLALYAIFSDETWARRFESRDRVRREYVCMLQTVTRHALRHSDRRGTFCGAPVYRSGSQTGHAFSPADVSPSYLTPLMDILHAPGDPCATH